MNDCQKRGHINIISKCEDCDQIIDRATFKEPIVTENMTEWISVKDQLPGINSPCRVKNGTNENDAWFLESKEGYYFCIGLDVGQTWIPTHWMPLPEPPQ